MRLLSRFAEYYTLALVVAAFITAVVIGWQSWETRKSAEATRKNADAFIESERAWVTADIGEIPAFTPDPNKPEILWVRPTIRNLGKTTARIKRISARQHQVGTINGLPPVPEYAKPQQLDAVLPPNVPLQFVNVGISAKDFIEFQHGAKFLYLYGFVDYLILGGIEKQTRFCFIWHVQGGFNPNPNGFYATTDVPEPYTRST